MEKNLSIVIATINEENNINKLFQKIKKSLEDIDFSWEIIFIDDSKDTKTSNAINKLRNTEDNIYLIKRYENKGLSSALTLGALSSNSQYIVFMDADLQHPPEKIKDLYRKINKSNFDLVSASRFMEENKVLDKKRYRASLFVNNVLKKLFKITYSDFLTGFFIVNKEFFHKNYNSLSKKGFKLLLDIILSTKNSIKYSEIPFQFEKRYSGKSKLNLRVVIDFLELIIDKLFAKLQLGAFVVNSIIITIIAIFQFSAFYMLQLIFSFQYSLILSVFLIILFNFIINNEITYSGLKKRGKYFYNGLVKFYFFCFFGSIYNYFLAKTLIDNSFNIFLAVFLGALVGSLWNYLVSKS